MKRFSKILIIILTLVVIATSSSVVVLADEETDYIQKPSNNVWGVDGTLDSLVAGDAWSISESVGLGGQLAVEESYPNGNKYLIITGSRGSTASLSYNYFGGDDSTIRTGYNMSKYPIVAFDFDLMTPNGDWGLYSTSSHNEGNSAGICFKPYYDGEQISDGWFKQISFGALGLPTTSYVWYHVTVIFEWSSESVDGVTAEYIEQTVYVNGQALTNSHASWVSGIKINITDKGASANGAGMFFGPVYVKSSKYETSSKQAIDNMQYTYFKDGYDISKIPTLVYNENWKAPFGKVIATASYTDEEGNNITKYFDNLNDAADFTKLIPQAIISLVGNMTEPYYIDSEVTIDARKLDENGEYTGEVYTGVDIYARTAVGYHMIQTEIEGVYKSVKGDFMVSQTDGSYIAYPTREFTSQIFMATDTTLKLLNDIEVDEVFTVNKTNYTIDLNGYSLKRVSYYGDVYNYDESSGEYIKADIGISSKSDNLFTLNHVSGAHSYGFRITSSNGQGKIYNLNYKSDIYYKGNELVRYDNLQNQTTRLIYTQASYGTSGNTFTFENFDHYGGKVLVVDSNGRRNLNFCFDNIRHYQMNAHESDNMQYAFYLSANVGFNLQVTNSLFYFNDHEENLTSGLIKVASPLSSSSYTTDIKFKNCDIIANDDGADKVGIVNAQAGDKIQLIGCRVYNFDTAVDAVRISKGTLVNYQDGVYHIPQALDGWSNKTLAKSITKTYTVPALDGWNFTEQGVDLTIETKQLVCTYNTIATKEVVVTVGESSATLIPGVSTVYDALRVYADTESDMLLNKIYILKDASGNVVESILGIYNGQFSFDWDNAVLTTAEETMNVGGIKADFNLNFLSGFRYNLYIPADARLSEMAVEGFEKAENTAIIYGNEYFVYNKIVGTTEAAETNVIYATFKVDGVGYSQSWNINAISYADMLLDMPSAQYPHEADALGAMAKFIKEAVLLTVAEPDTTAIDALITKSEVAAEYGQYTEGNVDALADFNGIIADVQYSIFNGVAAYKFITVEEGTELTFTVNGEEIKATVSGTEITLEAMRVYDIIDPITVTCGDVSATFTMVDYLTKLNNAEGIEIAKALYEFGVAADSYKAEIIKANINS